MADLRPRRTRRFREAPLSRETVLAAALRIADDEGVAALSMRRLGQALDVEAMSLYKHVAGKEDVLDGIADLVMAEVELPPADLPWREAVRRGAVSTHEALLRHPWAAPVLESRLTPGPRRLTYLEAMVAAFRRGGLGLRDVSRAFMALDAHVYGFTIQELSFPFDLGDAPEEAAAMRELFAAHYPNLAAMADLAMPGGAGVAIEFEFGLDLLLDGLERMLETR
jgi:AcrR family transcriptional regulator